MKCVIAHGISSFTDLSCEVDDKTGIPIYAFECLYKSPKQFTRKCKETFNSLTMEAEHFSCQLLEYIAINSTIDEFEENYMENSLVYELKTAYDKSFHLIDRTSVDFSKKRYDVEENSPIWRNMCK